MCDHKHPKIVYILPEKLPIKKIVLLLRGRNDPPLGGIGKAISILTRRLRRLRFGPPLRKKPMRGKRASVLSVNPLMGMSHLLKAIFKRCLAGDVPARLAHSIGRAFAINVSMITWAVLDFITVIVSRLTPSPHWAQPLFRGFSRW